MRTAYFMCIAVWNWPCAFGKHEWKWVIEPEYCTHSSLVLHPGVSLDFTEVIGLLN